MKRLWIILAILVVGCCAAGSGLRWGRGKHYHRRGYDGRSDHRGATRARPQRGRPPPRPAVAAKRNVIGVCLPALDNPLMLALKDTFVNEFGATYDVQVSSADGNPNTQASQVENYTACRREVHIRDGSGAHKPAAQAGSSSRGRASS